jgi:hypothetical protein
MVPLDVEGKIRELERVRAQARWWRLGLTLAACGIVLVSVAAIANAVQGLTQPGPRQQEFASTLSAGLQRDVVPNVQNIASQTFNEIRPEIEKEFSKVNDRVPELTQASLTQLNLLQKNVPERSEKVIRASFSAMLKKREPELRQMFPEVTEEKVAALVTNLSEEGQNRIVLANDSLFSGHMAAMNSIVADMEKIRLAEKPDVSSEQASWEAGLIFLDLVRGEMKGFESKSAPGTTPATAPMKTLPGKRVSRAPAASPALRQEARL